MRPLVYGNGRLLIGVDEQGVIRDIYYPHGYENHGDRVRMGVYDSEAGDFGWMDSWDIDQSYRSRFSNPFGEGTRGGPVDSNTPSLIGETKYDCEDMCLGVRVWDALHWTQDIFYRVVEVENRADCSRQLKLFTNQYYTILENPLANTAYHDGDTVIHYKRNRYFLLGSHPKFDQYTMGIAAWAGMEGTWKDAEDGEPLSVLPLTWSHSTFVLTVLEYLEALES